MKNLMRGAGVLVLSASVLLAEPPQEAAFKYLSPQEAIEKMDYPEGFVVKAFAAEPQCQQPFAFTFDERGRVWMCENLNYETRGSDLYDKGPLGRIVILTDTDGDGIADERKIFKDKIMFPTGIALGHGGVYVGSPPNLLFIPDRNRDDVPDGEPVVKLDGWGRQDRHETLNSFLWGPDGWLYGTHGVFTHSKVGRPGTPDDERVPINAGVWRYHPLNETFEVFAWGTSNPWGLDFDAHGQAFVTACVIPHLFHMIQGGRYHRQGGEHFNPHVYDDIKTIADHRHASAHGGARFYLADQFPEEYRHKLFMCNIHTHGVYTDDPVRKGSGFTARKHKCGLDDGFCMTGDAQWLGFNMELGPDGSIYVIDWHDSDICGRKVLHQKTGRLWRISYGDVKFPTGMDLTKLSDAELVEMHLHNNEWYARQARRLLQERALEGRLLPATLAGLRRILDENPDVTRRLRALWTLQLVGGLGDVMLAPMLDDEEEYIRAWAIQMIAEDRRVPDAVLQKWATMAKSDPSAVVRLYLASAMQRLEPEKRWEVLEALVGHAEDAGDHNLPLLIWYALEPLVVLDKERIAKVEAACKIDRIKEFIARRKGDGEAAAAEPANEFKKVKAEPAKTVPEKGLVLHLQPAELGGAQWGAAVQNAAEAQPMVVDSLGGRRALRFDGKDDRLVVPHRDELAFGKDEPFSLVLWVHADGSDKGWAGLVTKGRDREPWYGLWIDPAGRWLMGATDSNVPGPKVEPGWHHLCMTQEKGRRNLYLDGYLVAQTGRAPAADGSGDLWIGGAASVNEFFSGGINEVRVYARTLTPGEVSHLAARPAGAASVGARAEEARPELFAHYRALLAPHNLAGADLVHGKAVFAESCGQCHTVRGEGGTAGPELSAAKLRDLDYLLPHVLDPDGEIDEEYRYHKFELHDERVVLGVIAEESQDRYTLESLAGRFTLAKEQVAHREVLPYSLMPDAVFQTMTDEEVRDLAGFLGRE